MPLDLVAAESHRKRRIPRAFLAVILRFYEETGSERDRHSEMMLTAARRAA